MTLAAYCVDGGVRLASVDWRCQEMLGHCVTVYDVIGSSMKPVGIQVCIEPQPRATSIELFLVLWTCGGRGGDHIPQEGQKNIFERELKINPATES